MSWLVRNYWVRGAIFFAGSLIVLNSIFDLSHKCRDGWGSGSIGIQGACSHHGGVDRSSWGNAFFASIVVGLIAAFAPKIRSAFEITEQRKLEKLEIQKQNKLVDAWNQEMDSLREFFADHPCLAPDQVPECREHGRLKLVITLERKSVYRCREWKHCHFYHPVAKELRSLEALQKLAMENGRIAQL